MLLFDINSTTQVNLLNVDAVKLVGGKSKSLALIVNGQTYIVDESRHKDLINKLDNLQKSYSLTKQYVAM